MSEVLSSHDTTQPLPIRYNGGYFHRSPGEQIELSLRKISLQLEKLVDHLCDKKEEV